MASVRLAPIYCLPWQNLRPKSYRKLQAVLKRLDQIRPEAVPIETLRRMQAEIHSNYAELAGKGLEYEEAAQGR